MQELLMCVWSLTLLFVRRLHYNTILHNTAPNSLIIFPLIRKLENWLAKETKPNAVNISRPTVIITASIKQMWYLNEYRKRR